MFKVLASQFTSHSWNAFLFVPNSKYTQVPIENAQIDVYYTSFPVRDDGNKLYIFLCRNNKYFNNLYAFL